MRPIEGDCGHTQERSSEKFQHGPSHPGGPTHANVQRQEPLTWFDKRV